MDSSCSILDAKPTTPLLSSTTSNSSSSSESGDESPAATSKKRFDFEDFKVTMVPKRFSCSNFHSYKSLVVLSGHIGSVSCLSLCGEFILSASQGKDIIVWQQPDLRQFTKFGSGEGSVKALVTVGSKVFTAHQDSRIRVWKVSSSNSENVFRLCNSLPTAKDYMGNFMKQSNYVQKTRRHDKKRLWIEHADSISCLTVCNGLIYSGSWDKTLKVWRISDFKCLESIKAHDDAINGLVSNSNRGIVYSASADGKIKAWGKTTTTPMEKGKLLHCQKGIMEGHKDVSLNSVVVSEDGNIVYGGGSDGYIMGWSNSNTNSCCWNWKVICEVKAHKMAILCICFIGDEILCSGSADRSIGIWKKEMNGGIFRIGMIKGHEGPVKCLQASPRFVGGGFMLYSGSLDKTIRVWWVPNYSSSKSGGTQDSSSCLLNSM